MNINEEIMLAKKEKELNEKVSILMDSLNIISSDAADILNVKYNKTAEILREFDYNTAFFDILKQEKKYGLITELREEINVAKRQVLSSDIKIISEGYETLAEAYCFLEMYNGGSEIIFTEGFAKELNEFLDFESLNEEALNEGKLWNKVRWKLALFSLKFLSDQTLNDFFKAYYGKKPEKMKEILSQKRKFKVRKLREIANEKLSPEAREKIANSEAAKKCEKAAAFSGIATGISGLTAGFAVARAANSTTQYIAAKKEAEAMSQKQPEPPKLNNPNEKTEKEEIIPEKTEKEEIIPEKTEKEETKSDITTDTLEDGVKRDGNGKITLSSLYPTSKTKNWVNSSDLTDEEKGEIMIASQAISQAKMSSDLDDKGGTLASIDNVTELTDKDVIQNLISAYRNEATRLQNNGGNKNLIDNYRNRANYIENEYNMLDSADGKRGNLSVDEFVSKSKILTGHEGNTLKHNLYYNSAESIEDRKNKLQFGTYGASSSGYKDGYDSFDDYNGLTFENIKKMETFFTTNKDNTVTVDIEGLHKYLESIHGNTQEIMTQDGDRRLITAAISSIGDKEIYGDVIIKDNNKIFIVNAGDNYTLPKEIINGLKDGTYTYLIPSQDGKYMPDTTLKEAMSEEKKQDIKTGIQLFMSALSALAMTIFPLICGAALGGAIAMGVIAGTAAVNTGISAVRTGKLAHRASVIRRDEMMRELLKGPEEDR